MYLNEIVKNINNSHVLIVGDIILDKYITGSVGRISPEAPVPVLKTKEETETLGGAGNVANNIAMLKSNCKIISTAGNDLHKQSISNMLSKLGVESTLFDAGLPTTTKIRVVGGRQQIVRIDYEELIPTDHPVLEALEKSAINDIKKFDAVVISDYGKGTISHAVAQKIITEANRLHKPTIIDPKGNDWSKYIGATLVTPNVKELAEVAGINVSNTDEAVAEVGKQIRQKYGLTYLVVTRSEKGVSIIGKDFVSHIPTQAKEVYDVSGAGDTVVATIASSLASGVSINDAVKIANIAAGIVVSKSGTAPITFAELSYALNSVSRNSQDKTSVPLETAITWIENHKLNNRTIVFTNGCFDIIHRGHADYLAKAKKLGDILVVGLNSDDSVKRLKGAGRPINNQEDRAFVLSSLESVDYVIIFDEDTPANLIKAIKPNFLVKGGDYKLEEVVGREDADEVVLISFVDGYSTTQTIKKLKNG